ncbi:MAG: GDSL-type esterase/lipase family protein, partial [Litorimonas sp.]
MSRCLLTGAAGVAAILVTMQSADAAPFEDVYAFGDSLADCCFSGRFTQGDTPTWVDLLPPLIGATYVPTRETNLAVGGAQSGATNVAPGTDDAFGFLTGFTSQIARFAASPLATTIEAADIAVIWVGTNDVWAAP